MRTSRTSLDARRKKTKGLDLPRASAVPFNVVSDARVDLCWSPAEVRHRVWQALLLSSLSALVGCVQMCSAIHRAPTGQCSLCTCLLPAYGTTALTSEVQEMELKRPSLRSAQI